MLLFVDNLTNVDFSYLDPDRGLVGETWLANIRLHGDLDEQSMVCDFGRVKKNIRRWLDAELDHRLAVPARAEQLSIDEHDGGIDLVWRLNDGTHIQLSGPRQAIALVDASELTPESIARWCESQLLETFDRSLEKLELDFATEEIDGAFYHYSHGLKKHDGNCQRIAHGHRSRIDIWLGGEKAPSLERDWAERWRDIYLGTREDITGAPEFEGVSYYDFAYRAEQGQFSLRIPQKRCEIIDTDTTVECLAEYIAEQTTAEYPDQPLRIRAYEGINKGAEAFRQR